ncbi:hypothetical protein B4109_1795 [Geobacillus stearothermophilus]|uniref:Uncharacterized protein n=1 Tax=Geobacillus stearothermophilus TaxID=1422 RepID=A0A150MK90_GEOSE|nr:hypothetical protein B4109_1795 [Geobacillus stearothermophilus]
MEALRINNRSPMGKKPLPTWGTAFLMAWVDGRRFFGF